MTELEKLQALVQDNIEVRCELGLRTQGIEGTDEEDEILAEVAARHGIHLTLEELRADRAANALANQALEQAAKELSDEELERVSGGQTCLVGRFYYCDTDLWEDQYQSRKMGRHIKGKFEIVRNSTSSSAQAPILLGENGKFLGWVVRGGCDCV